MRCQLRAPRQAFSINWSGGASSATYWSFDPTSAPDNAWGPHPGELNVYQFSGGLAALYGWTISAFRNECFGDSCMAGTALNSQILSINRTYSFSVDANGMTTRTINGKLVCTSQDAPADQYRYVIEPDLPANFKRDSRQYSQSEDGRILTFTIVDIEQLYTLPTPITNGGANFSIITQGGLLSSMTLVGFFESTPSTPKSAILNVIATLATTKFNLSSSQSVIPATCTISTDVYKNRVDFNFAFVAAGGVGTPNTANVFAGFQGNTAQFVANPPNSNGVAYITGPYGGDASKNSGVIGAAPAIYDACSISPVTSADNIGSGSPGSTPPGGALTESPGTGSNSGISSEHLQNPYLAYGERYNFSYDSGIVPLYPKQKNAAPIMQQVRNPRLILIQAGYLKQYMPATTSTPPVPPPPFMESGSSGTDYTLMLSDIEPANAEPVGDGSWNLWTVNWRYVLHYNSAITNDSGAAMKYPGDPRRSNSNDIAIPSSGFPDVVTTPADFGD